MNAVAVDSNDDGINDHKKQELPLMELFGNP